MSEIPEFVQQRVQLWDKLKEKKANEKKPSNPIKITLPSGDIKEGVSFETTPMSVAKSISSSLARAIIIADVDGKLWDLNRPLEGDCSLSLLKFDDKRAKEVFWHSSAHVLGQALELKYHGDLCIGPPLDNGGFYYDIALNEGTVSAFDLKELQKMVQKIVKSGQPFERMELSKVEALEMFASNKFKQEIITDKIGADEVTTAYRCGPLIDLCRGPHVPSTKTVSAFRVTKNSSAYWHGDAANESLQRVYGISFPSKKELNAYLAWEQKAAKRDHRVIARQQSLAFFDQLSPGSAFWQPHGARIYNKLQQFMQAQYRVRGFQEVVTPNIFHTDLWKISGHLKNYAENMFLFKTGENEDWAMKAMNCPGHCVMFQHSAFSFRDLPVRFADFGVLHRNELAGALGGLTRVRRFCQDDAHIFCAESQVQAEVAGCIDFLTYVYGVFDFHFELELSTRPEKMLGTAEQWDLAEDALRKVLDDYKRNSGKDWKLNEGDGAFYGPKIDVMVRDAMNRTHQCATIQLDFQLPQRFGLAFAGGDEKQAGADNKDSSSNADDNDDDDDKNNKDDEAAHEAAKAAHEAAIAEHRALYDDLPDRLVPRMLQPGQHRPVVIHRAIYGSFERFIGILMEQFGGRWPLWISPRQVCVVPVSGDNVDYAKGVVAKLAAANIYVDLSYNAKTMNKRIAEASKLQYNYILVVGKAEQDSDSVNVRRRPAAGQKFVKLELMKFDDFRAKLDAEIESKQRPSDQDWFVQDEDEQEEEAEEEEDGKN